MALLGPEDSDREPSRATGPEGVWARSGRDYSRPAPVDPPPLNFDQPAPAYGGPSNPVPEKTFTDDDRAIEYRARLGQLLHPITRLMDEADKNGLELRWAVQKAPSGKHISGPIDIVKHF